MKKSGRLLVFILLALVLSSFISVLMMPMVSAIQLDDESSEDTSLITQLQELLKKWEKGDQVDAIAVKYFFLILLAVLVYSILTSVEFPDNNLIRILLAIIVSFLATYLITPDEFWAILSSYTTLGITLFLFLPIMILIFATIVTSKVGNPVGVFFTRIIWLVYAIGLILKSALIVLFRVDITNANKILFELSGGSSIAYNIAIPTGETIAKLNLNGAKIGWVSKNLIFPLIDEATLKSSLNANFGIAVLLIVISLVILWIVFKKYSEIDATVKDWMREAKLERVGDKFKTGAGVLGKAAEAGEEAARS